MSSIPLAVARAGALAFGALVCVASAQAHDTSAAGAQQVYEHERARCIETTSGDARASCLQSAGAALEEARRGRLDVSEHNYSENSVRRCEPLPASDREDCLRRMHGEGTTSGSVEGGGILREKTTVEVHQVPAS